MRTLGIPLAVRQNKCALCDLAVGSGVELGGFEMSNLSRS